MFVLLVEFIFLQLGFSMHEIVQAALRFRHVLVSLVHGKKHTGRKPPLAGDFMFGCFKMTTYEAINNEMLLNSQGKRHDLKMD